MEVLLTIECRWDVLYLDVVQMAQCTEAIKLWWQVNILDFILRVSHPADICILPALHDSSEKWMTSGFTQDSLTPIGRFLSNRCRLTCDSLILLPRSWGRRFCTHSQRGSIGRGSLTFQETRSSVILILAQTIAMNGNSGNSEDIPFKRNPRAYTLVCRENLCEYQTVAQRWQRRHFERVESRNFLLVYVV